MSPLNYPTEKADVKMFGWLKRLFGGTNAGPGDETPIKSLVWLLDAPRRITSETLLILARQEFGDDLIDVQQLPANDDLPGDMFIVIIKPQYGIGVISAHRPYVENPEQEAEQITEARRASLFAKHKAWLAADLMGEAPKKPGYRAAAKLLSALSGPDCLLLYSTEEGLMEPYDETLPQRLLQGNPLKTLRTTEYSPVVNRPPDDQELAAAAAEAERTWPDFVQAFQAQHPNCEHFSVKAPFTTSDDGIEWMWVAVQAIDGDSIQGEVANDPIDVPGIKLGSKVTIERQKIQDWLYVRNGDMVGGYTSRILMKG